MPLARKASFISTRLLPAGLGIVINKTDFNFRHTDAGEENPRSGILLITGNKPKAITGSQTKATYAVYQQVCHATLHDYRRPYMSFAHSRGLVNSGHG